MMVVTDQAAGIHDLLGFDTERCAGLDCGAQHVAGGNLGNAELSLEMKVACVPLPAPGAPNRINFMNSLPCM